MARPDLTVYRDLPVYGVPSPRRLGHLEGILRSLEMGLFRDAALLCDSMLRDDRISGVLMARLNGLLGLALVFTAAKDTARGKLIAEDAEESWPDMFPPDQISELLRWGILLGIGVGELIWARDAGEWKPRLRVWHPQFVRWDWNTQAYWLIVDGAQEIRLDPGDGKWVVYTPYGYEYAWLRGLARPLAEPWLSRRWARRDWSQYSEEHGKPTRLAIVPSTAEKTEKNAFVNRVSVAESNTTIKLERDANDKGFDLKLLEAVANNHEGFEMLLKHLDVAIAVCINGQNMSTDGLGGLGAQEKAGEPVRVDIKRKDALIADVLREQALTWWALYNYGARELTPWPAWEVDPPEDGKAIADELNTLADAVTKFKAAGAPIDVRALLEEHDVPMLSEAELADLTKAEHPGFIPGATPDQLMAPADGETPLTPGELPAGGGRQPPEQLTDGG